MIDVPEECDSGRSRSYSGDPEAENYLTTYYKRSDLDAEDDGEEQEGEAGPGDGGGSEGQGDGEVAAEEQIGVTDPPVVGPEPNEKKVIEKEGEKEGEEEEPREVDAGPSENQESGEGVVEEQTKAVEPPVVAEDPSAEHPIQQPSDEQPSEASSSILPVPLPAQEIPSLQSTLDPPLPARSASPSYSQRERRPRLRFGIDPEPSRASSPLAVVGDLGTRSMSPSGSATAASSKRRSGKWRGYALEIVDDETGEVSYLAPEVDLPTQKGDIEVVEKDGTRRVVKGEYVVLPEGGGKAQDVPEEMEGQQEEEEEERDVAVPMDADQEGEEPSAGGSGSARITPEATDAMDVDGEDPADDMDDHEDEKPDITVSPRTLRARAAKVALETKRSQKTATSSLVSPRPAPGSMSFRERTLKSWETRRARMAGPGGQVDVKPVIKKGKAKVKAVPVKAVGVVRVRNKAACHQCHARRIACDYGPSNKGTCLGCFNKGTVCEQQWPWKIREARSLLIGVVVPGNPHAAALMREGSPFSSSVSVSTGLEESQSAGGSREDEEMEVDGGGSGSGEGSSALGEPARPQTGRLVPVLPPSGQDDQITPITGVSDAIPGVLVSRFSFDDLCGFAPDEEPVTMETVTATKRKSVAPKTPSKTPSKSTTRKSSASESGDEIIDLTSPAKKVDKGKGKERAEPESSGDGMDVDRPAPKTPVKATLKRKRSDDEPEAMDQVMISHVPPPPTVPVVFDPIADSDETDPKRKWKCPRPGCNHSAPDEDSIYRHLERRKTCGPVKLIPYAVPHPSGRPYACPTEPCDFAAVTEENIRLHFWKSGHKPLPMDEGPGNFGSPSPAKKARRFVCRWEDCYVAFSSSGWLAYHKRQSGHQAQPKATPQKEKEFSHACRTGGCVLRFATKVELDSHAEAEGHLQPRVGSLFARLAAVAPKSSVPAVAPSLGPSAADAANLPEVPTPVVHQPIEDPPLPFPCFVPDCGRSFYTGNARHQHAVHKQHMPEKAKLYVEKDVPAQVNKTPRQWWHCLHPDCESRLDDSEADLIAHQRAAGHPMTRWELINGKIGHDCFHYQLFVDKQRDAGLPIRPWMVDGHPRYLPNGWKDKGFPRPSDAYDEANLGIRVKFPESRYYQSHDPPPSGPPPSGPHPSEPSRPTPVASNQPARVEPIAPAKAGESDQKKQELPRAWSWEALEPEASSANAENAIVPPGQVGPDQVAPVEPITPSRAAEKEEEREERAREQRLEAFEREKKRLEEQKARLAESAVTPLAPVGLPVIAQSTAPPAPPPVVVVASSNNDIPTQGPAPSATTTQPQEQAFPKDPTPPPAQTSIQPPPLVIQPPPLVTIPIPDVTGGQRSLVIRLPPRRLVAPPEPPPAPEDSAMDIDPPPLPVQIASPLPITLNPSSENPTSAPPPKSHNPPISGKRYPPDSLLVPNNQKRGKGEKHEYRCLAAGCNTKLRRSLDGLRDHQSAKGHPGAEYCKYLSKRSTGPGEVVQVQEVVEVDAGASGTGVQSSGSSARKEPHIEPPPVTVPRRYQYPPDSEIVPLHIKGTRGTRYDYRCTAPGCFSKLKHSKNALEQHQSQGRCLGAGYVRYLSERWKERQRRKGVEVDDEDGEPVEEDEDEEGEGEWDAGETEEEGAVIYRGAEGPRRGVWVESASGTSETGDGSGDGRRGGRKGALRSQAGGGVNKKGKGKEGRYGKTMGKVVNTIQKSLNELVKNMERKPNFNKKEFLLELGGKLKEVGCKFEDEADEMMSGLEGIGGLEGMEWRRGKLQRAVGGSDSPLTSE